MDWLQLRSEFEALREPLRLTRLDYQWGAAGIYYRLAGGGISSATRQFEVLAGIAGSKLTSLPAGAIDDPASTVSDSASRWYEALRQYSGAFEFGFVGTQTNEAGEDLGRIYSGTLNTPAESSALLCLKLSTVPMPQPAAIPDPQPVEHLGVLDRMERYLRKEAEERRYLWLIIAFLVTVLLAALAL